MAYWATLIRLGLWPSSTLLLCYVMCWTFRWQPRTNIRLIPLNWRQCRSISWRLIVVCLSASDTEVEFAAHYPQDPFVTKALRVATGRQITMRLGLAADIDTALEQRSQQDEEVAEEAFSVFNADDDDFVEHLKDLASEAPVIQRNQIIQRSLEIAASDIHLECFEDGLRLRYRIDGVLQEASQTADSDCRLP